MSEKSDYIWKAAHHANGFLATNTKAAQVAIVDVEWQCNARSVPQWFKDALAAQLKRQVNKTAWKVHEYPDQTIICNRNDKHYCIHKGNDCTDNTIRTCVDFLELRNGGW